MDWCGMDFKPIISRAKRALKLSARIGVWLGECAVYAVVGAWPFLLLLLIFAVAHGASTLFGAGERTLRLTGMVLQIGGFIMAVYQLLETRKHLNLPFLWQGFVRYLHNFPKLNRRIELTANIEPISSSISMGYAILRNPNAKLRERIGRIERDVDALSERIRSLELNTSAEIDNAKRELLEKNRELEESLRLVEGKFSRLIGGGTTLEIVGVIYFLIGLLLASASQELALLAQIWEANSVRELWGMLVVALKSAL